MLHGTLQDLTALLSLNPLGDNRFAGRQAGGSRARVYGGQFLGQGLMAASRICSGSVQSFHCYYLRPGATDAPFVYVAEAVGDALVNVRATQHGKTLFIMDVAFGAFVPAPDLAMPAVAPPAHGIDREVGIQGLPRDTDSTWAVTDSPFAYRFVENIWDAAYVTPGHNVWFRIREPDQVDPAMPQILAQAMTAYFADDPIMDNALFPHGWQRAWRELQTASLDHAMWFHAPLDLREWLLFAQDSPIAAGARALTRGLMFDQHGRLVASACQEILMRPGPA